MRADFHPLVVGHVEPLTDDSAAVSFVVPEQLRQTFDFAAGQTLTVRRGDQRRTYSICAATGQPPRIGVREVAGGAVSSWLVNELRAGDIVDVQPPSGRFTPDLTTSARHVMIAAGSGITPMMSIAASVLGADQASTVTLLYGNRRTDTVMFADELSDLKDSDPARMRIVHVLSREPQEVDLFSGRLDRERLTSLLPATVDIDSIDHWWLCGPFELVNGAISVLTDLGVDRSRIHRELFWVGDSPPVEATHVELEAVDGASLTVILDGRESTLILPADVAILVGAQGIRPDLPFACKGGVCGTCRAKVVTGSATMRRNYALEDDEVSAGYVLTCQALPATDEITVDYDA